MIFFYKKHLKLDDLFAIIILEFANGRQWTTGSVYIKEGGLLDEKKKVLSARSARRVEKDRGGAAIRPLVGIAAVCLVVYSVVMIISQQVQIVQLRQQKEEISAQMNEAQQLNDEYNRMLASDDESDYMEKIAIEKLGYAYPDERRFYVVEAH